MSIRSILGEKGVLAHVILPSEIDLLLSALEPPAPPTDLGGGIFTGNVKLVDDLSKSPIPGFDFALTVPSGVVDPAPFKLKLEPADAPTGFKFWITLAKQGQVYLGFKFVEGAPGMVLTGAAVTPSADGSVTLTPLAGQSPILVSRSTEPGSDIGPALLVSGSAAEPASLRLTPDTDSTEGIVALGLEPPAVLFGGSGIGFHCPVIVIDDSETAHGPGQGAPALAPPLATISADTDSWRGILARELDFYLPPSIPFFGGHPIKGYLAIPRGEGGVELVIETQVPARPAAAGQSGRPGYAIRIECIDPTAKGLSGLVPTLIRAVMELPLDGSTAALGAAGPITFAAGKPLRLIATLSRDPVNAPGDLLFALGVAAEGAEGLLSVTTGPADAILSPAKIFNTAAAMATALIADQNIPSDQAVGNSTGVVLSALAAAGAALSSLFQPESQFVLNGAEIETTGHGLPVGGAVTLSLDYSVAVRVIKIGIPGALSVEMRKDQPMRIRLRRVRMSVDPNKSGLSMIGLDFDRAEMEIENPGAWDVGGLRQLFDVVGSRSGRGSSWIEVDLRFKLNLGPVRVSGVTIRATLNNGTPEVSIRGLEASLFIPHAIEGSGSVHMIEGGFEANLAASIVPLGVSADAGVIYDPSILVLKLDVDLPAPIPLANSGFGLFGIGGMLAFSAVPNYGGDSPDDPLLRQLKWEPQTRDDFTARPSQSTFGLAAVVGTLPDLGFSFSAKAGLTISVPDVAVRASLNGRVLQPVTKMADKSYPPSWGISFLGFLGVDSEALSFAVIGTVDLTPLLLVKVPIAGHFPFTETDNWYTYLGADGYPDQGRSIGPISATVLPGILDVGAEAYVMMRGRGIAAWPYGRSLPGAPLTLSDGFVLAFGFALQSVFGAKPIAWAELYASLDLLVGAKPTTLAGFGRAGGSLNLGPFSLGVQAKVSFFAQDDTRYFWAEVTGRIELLFFDIEGTVTISFGTSEEPDLPPPNRHPLDLFDADGRRAGSTPTLTDDSYRVLARLVEDPGQITAAMRVWPDTMISLPFAVAPEIAAVAGAQFPGVLGPGAAAPVKIGSEMLFYKWRLDRLSLVDVTDEADRRNGPGVAPAGALSSRWQTGRGTPGDVSELLLFSFGADLWVNRMANGGKDLPGDPLRQAADICGRAASAESGWAVGYLASVEAAGFRLPPDPVSLDPKVSRVVAHMHHFAVDTLGNVTPLDLAFTLPSAFSIDAARIVAWPETMEIKRDFAGHIVAPDLRFLTGISVVELLRDKTSFRGQLIRLELDEAITGGLLILVGDPSLFEIQEMFDGVIVRDAGDMWEREPDFVRLPTGEFAALFHQRTRDPVGGLTVSYPLNAAIGVVGLGGTTTSADTAAVTENNAIQDLIALLADAKADGPKTNPHVFRRHHRATLAPGRVYRLDIDMSWSGELYKQDEGGNGVLVKSVTDQSAYAPKGSGPISTNRQLFFETAPKPALPAPQKSGALGYANWLYRRQDVFEPEMIERYLAGYEPAQSELFRFCDDPLRAHFRQNHVAALAKAYGFTLSVAVRRIDRAGDENATPTLFDLVWSFATNPVFLSPADQIRSDYAMTSRCDVPTPGATGTADTRLAPEAWYETYVLAKADDPDHVADGRLPGVTFRTSRWRTPEAMFAGLGLTVTSAAAPEPDPVMAGDLSIPSAALPGAPVIDGDDQAFQNALVALGLDGWPVATAARISRLWTPSGTGGWLFAGLMMESPEPIHREGRLELDPATPTLEMGRAGAGITFGIRRRDSSGARLIWLTATPFAVVTRERIINPRWPLVRLWNQGLPRFTPIEPKLAIHAIGKGLGAGHDVTGTLAIPVAPAFAEDP